MPGTVWWGRSVVGKTLRGAAILVMGFAIAVVAGTSRAFAACGDGFLDAGEQCDNGAQNGQFGQCCYSDCTFLPGSQPCRDVAGVCDVWDNCTGSSGTCPADQKADLGTLCRPAAGPCDVAEGCAGGNACPPDLFAQPSQVCRVQAYDCDKDDFCTGLGVTCPEDLVDLDGSPCTSDGNFCTGAESCLAGVCTSNPPVCDDGNPCTNDFCSNMLGACSSTPAPDSELAAGPDGYCGTTDDNLDLFGTDGDCGTSDDLVGDGLCADNCQKLYNPDQRDSDFDGKGDVCDATPCPQEAIYLLGGFQLKRFDLDVNGDKTLVASVPASAKDLVVDPEETYAWMTVYGQGQLIRRTLATGAITVVGGYQGPWGVDRGPNGWVWVADRDGGSIARHTGMGAGAGFITGLSEPTGIAVNQAGTQIYVTEYGSGELSSVGTAGGAPVLVAGGFDRPLAVELGAGEATAYVLDSSGRLSAVDLATSNVSVVHSMVAAYPLAMALNPTKTFAYVTARGGTYTVNLQSSARFDMTAELGANNPGIFQGPKSRVMLFADQMATFQGTADPMLHGIELTDRGVYSADFTVRWNALVLAPQGIQPHSSAVAAGCTAGWNVDTPGQAIVSVYCTSPLSDGPLVVMSFQHTAADGKGTPLLITTAVLNEGSPAVCVRQGSIYRPVTVRGVVTYYRDPVSGQEPSNTRVADVHVETFHETSPGVFVLDGETVTACGQAEHVSPPWEPVKNYRVRPRRDGGFSGVVDPMDAALVSQYVLGLAPLTPSQRLAGDASGNGTLSSFDASLIARLSVGLIARLPVATAIGSDWGFVPVGTGSLNESTVAFQPATGEQGSFTWMPLTQSVLGVNFTAFLLGDVTANFAGCTGLLQGGTGTDALSLPGTVGLPSGGRLILPDIVAKQGDTIQVPVRAESLGAALSFYLDLRFKPGVLSLTSVTTGSAASRFTLTPNTSEPGRGRIALFGTSAMGADGNVAVLTFKVTGKPGSRTTLDLSSWTVNEGQIPALVTPGSVSVKRLMSKEPQ